MVPSKQIDFPCLFFLLNVAVLATFLETVHCWSINSDALRTNTFKVVEKLMNSSDVVMEQFTKPDFCHGLDCPAFKEIKKTKDYEERSYVATNWVSTHIDGDDYDEATRSMFMKLFNYINGNNAEKKKITMTAPVLVSVIPGPGPACSNNFTMSFFLIPSLTNPPTPLDKTVFLSALPKQNVFIKSFGGYANEKLWLKNAEALATSLVEEKESFNQDMFYTAGYDSPFRVLDRHNEVWYIAN